MIKKFLTLTANYLSAIVLFVDVMNGDFLLENEEGQP